MTIFQDPGIGGYHSLDEMVKYRVERSDLALIEARDSIIKGNNITAVNRLYYSCFYIINALFAKRQLYAKSHSGIKTLFNEKFVKTGIINSSYSSIYNELFNKRMKGDYEDFIEFSRMEVEYFLTPAEEFINEIKTILVSSNEK